MPFHAIPNFCHSCRGGENYEALGEVNRSLSLENIYPYQNASLREVPIIPLLHTSIEKPYLCNKVSLIM